MPRRVQKKRPSLLSPAGSLIKKLSETDKRHRRKALKISLWVVTLMFTYSLCFGTYSIPRVVKLSLRKSALVESNRELTARLIDGARERELLRSDATYIEQVARSRYFMVRPGETVYRYRSR